MAINTIPTEPTTNSNARVIPASPSIPTIPTVPIDTTTANNTRVIAPSNQDLPTDLPSRVKMAPTIIPPTPRPVIVAQPLRTRFFDEIPQEEKKDDAQAKLLQQLNLVPTTPTKPKKVSIPPPSSYPNCSSRPSLQNQDC